MFRSSFSLLKKNEPPVQAQDNIIIAWIIRHPTRNRNDPIAIAELYQLMHTSLPTNAYIFFIAIFLDLKVVFYAEIWKLSTRPKRVNVRV
ncbi:hypothetical protein GmHk_10G029505 [Glycine max]|nr:hypothetical protein GmHk_10G029505 [Glycine max]